MLKGFFSLLVIFAIGIMLMSIGLPKEFAILRGYVQGNYNIAYEALHSQKNIATIETPTSTTGTKSNQEVHGITEVKGEITSILSNEDIVDETNAQRIANGVEPLKKNYKLDTSAKIKVSDMITLQYFEHTSPSGGTVSDLGSLVGYDYIVMGENLALGNFVSAKELVSAWMASPGHRANILSKKYQEIGVYAAVGEYNGQKVWFAVQHFGTQKSVCPSISNDLRNVITNFNKELALREKQIEATKNDLEKPEVQFEPGYRDRVGEFNTLVAQYNSTLLVSKQKTDVYNKQVADFNECLVQFQ